MTETDSTAKETVSELSDDHPPFVQYRSAMMDTPYNLLTALDFTFNSFIFALLLATGKWFKILWMCNSPLAVTGILLTVHHGVLILRRFIVTVILCSTKERTKKSFAFVISLRAFCFFDIIVVPALTITSTVFFY